MLLECDGISKRFGGVHAVADVDLSIEPGQVFGLIGPNGAGKTTLVNLISGHLRVDSGAIRFAGSDVTRLAPHALTARGIARTFQGVRLFKGLTVLENVLVGRHALMAEGLTIVLIEHDVRLVMGTCDRVAVLNFGRKIAEGSPSQIQSSPVVREAYLGSEDVA